ncbi:MAG: aminomethyl transferase family protein [Phycisphaerales bacterium]|nr:aminomethyl transferase family protein [Phycisphaerales bacterium]
MKTIIVVQPVINNTFADPPQVATLSPNWPTMQPMETTAHNPLHHLHQQPETEFQAFGPIEIVSTFGQPQAEYAAIHKSCGMIDLPQRAVIELTGRDRATFLNNLITNEIANKKTKTALAPGQVVYAFLLNSKGRIVLDMNITELGEQLWLDLDARLMDSTVAALDRYLFADQVKITARTDLHAIALHGPGSFSILRDLSNNTLTDLQPMQAAQTRLLGRSVTLWRDDECGVAGYHLIAGREDMVVLWTSLQANFGQQPEQEPGKRRLRPVGWAAYNACRIEAGRPILGVDFDESVLPAETGQMARAVNMNKGCYIGQEIVLRMFARGKQARQFVGIRMDDDRLPLAGAKVLNDEGDEIGGITSSTLSPVLSNIALCMGYVRKPYYAEGSRLTIPAEGAMRHGTVVALPFDRSASSNS